jgi:glycopeptide antibiotics resistance protein
MFYTIPIRIALFSFPFVLVALLMPFLIWQYRKYGTISFWRFFMTFSFVFYLLTAYFLIILPLPSKEYVARLAAKHYPIYNLDPSVVVKDFLHYNPLMNHGLKAWKAGLMHSTFIQPFFNIVLLVPLGFFLNYYFKFKFKTTLICSFALSLFFELTQLTALYGLYSRPYRLFDVDDLILNTLGGIIGYSLVPIFEKLLPNLQEVDETSLQKSVNISFVRRLVAFIIDFALMCLVGVLFTKVFHNFVWQVLVSMAIVFVIIPLIFDNATVGMKIVKIKYASTLSDDSPHLWQIIVRNMVGFSFTFGLIYLFNLCLNRIGQKSLEDVYFYLGLLMGLTLPIIFLLVDYLLTFKTNHRTWYERLSRTKLISNFKF